MHREIVARYTNQPPELPVDLRERLAVEWRGARLELYALSDIDDSYRLREGWVALGATQLALAERAASGEWDVVSFDRSRVCGIEEAQGLSINALTLLAGPNEPPLATVRYTHRQRGAMENIRFVLDEGAQGRTVNAEDADRVYVEAVARPIQDAQALVSRRRAAVLLRLLSYLAPYRRELWLGFGAAAVITMASLAPPWLAGFLIDRVVRPAQDGATSVREAARLAWIAVGAMGVLYLVRQASALTRLRLMSVLGELVARDLRAELYAHLQRLSLSFFSRKKTGSLITRVTSDTDRLWDFVAFGVVDVSLSLIMLLGLSSVLLTLDWRLGLVMTLPVPLFCWLIYRHGESLNRVFIRAWRKWSAVTDVLSDTIPGIRVVRAFSQERREVERFGTRNQDVTNEFNRIHQMWTTFWPLLMLAVHATTVTVWVFAVPRLLGTGAELTTGTFVSFLLYATMFTGPIEIIGQMARTMNRATSSAHRVFEVLDSEPEVRDVVEPVRLSPVRGRVTFENVSFAYDGVRQVLRGVSFEVQPGELIGLVGASGGGKTTIVNLIARFYDASAGRVLVDGVDIRQLDSAHYREQLGMVLQEPYLFHGTVAENIRYGVPTAATRDVIAAARAANARDFVCKLAQGYDTVVGERGHTLSGGERQRISIARAILRNPRLLILDEATSSVDTETEREIQEALDRLDSGRTVFAIAHRLSTLRRASRLFVLEDGRLVETGTHQELLAIPNGVYRRLYELQLQLA
jgi:ATP-binding cassette subfamily B protein